MDFGGHQQGYCSDTTRMFVVGEAPYGFDDAYETLYEAQAAAVDAVSSEPVSAVVPRVDAPTRVWARAPDGAVSDTLRIVPIGFAIPWPAMSGADP